LLTRSWESNWEPTTTGTRPRQATSSHSRYSRTARQATSGDGKPDPGEEAPGPERLAFRASREVRHTVIRVITAHPQGGAAGEWQGLDFDFTGVVFDSGDFTGAVFSGGTVSFGNARFSGSTVLFTGAQFSGGEVFSAVQGVHEGAVRGVRGLA